MATPDFSIRQNDRLPDLTATLKDADGAAVDLTGATVRFHMRRSGETTPKVAAAAELVVAASGTVKYQWATGDTDTVGRYEGEFEATWSGKKETFPNDRYLSIAVSGEIA